MGRPLGLVVRARDAWRLAEGLAERAREAWRLAEELAWHLP
jgi:hypothetical protein